jgi:protease I
VKVLILTANGVEDVELMYPYFRLQEAGHEVTVATPDGKPAQGEHGYSVPADLAIDDLRADDYDALFLPGGKGPEKVRLEEKALEIARHFCQSSKVVGSICHGVQVLISAGVVKGRSGTCWWGIKDDMIAAGSEWHDEPVVVDGNWISSRYPHDLPHFCRELIDALGQQQSMAA